jgi:hypothetical protein
MLVALFPGFPHCSGFWMTDSTGGGYLILVLPALAASPEELHLEILAGKGEEELTWVGVASTSTGVPM